ncbi:PAAR domain-containing protein [Pseudomonas cichorii]|uniref:PAAR domain-containing protein n=1 Tax=Pseudomonas cichorii TaxID=36746 RepID=UPI001C8A71EC|nr:PAAR domain-containing protein [Pseudomonas cichorii]MBX8487903.1 PAAR domain-containing protein [Pseudomonas cichorii]MBX8497989.1 PAAR domain-containing protein [Pseudomonas cichorii]MBX8517690.1 PAAR domain-containing protein [Pseudomonas cichorii]MBX8532570.1 PAAR domain-containing protein [Pseudomonas cichorii]MBX8577577.1 PAAR domain-containing protein [Pseudomonas cichorii]
MAKPAARVTDPTACSSPGHAINPIVSGSPDVFFDGLAAARVTDKSACGSQLVDGVSKTVFINGLNAATVGSTGTHGNTVTAGSGTVIIGDIHTPAPFTPPLPLSFQKVFGQSFNISDSETGKPLALREFIATVDGAQVSGVTDAKGVAHIKSASPNSKISLHIKFNAPARTLNEFSEAF